MRAFDLPENRTIRHRVRSAIGVVATSALIAAGLLVVAPAAQAATGHVTGLVYVDYAQDGAYSTGNAASTAIANDRPLAGVTVTAYDANNAVVGTGTSAAALTATPRSNYDITLSGSVADGDPIRLEFTGLPANAYDSFAGADNGTTVQFTTAGSDGLDLGVASATEYNPGDPGIATSIQSAGIPSNAVSGALPAVVATAWAVGQNAPTVNTTPCQGTPPNPANCATFGERTTFATFAQVGAVWGLGYDASLDRLFMAATYKRMSGLKEVAGGGLGLGGIYVASDILDAAGDPKSPSSVTNWLDVTTLGIDIGQGDIQTNAARGIGAPGTPAADLSGFALSAKVGIGGVAVDPISRTLYFMNLKNSTVYGVNLDTKALVGSWPTPATGTQRAYAVTVHNGQLLVGYNDTGATAFQSASAAGLSYYVARGAIAVDGSVGAFTQVLTGSLGYNKGNPIYAWQGTGNTVANNNPQALRWNTWTDQWASGGSSVAFTSNGDWGSQATQVYPQAVLSTLAIDSAGYLSVGFQDRTSIQGGNRNHAALANPGTTYYETVSSGDMLLAAPGTNGTYTQENAGTAGIRTATAGRDQQLPATGASAGGEGPGRYEFYYDRQTLGAGANHREASLGAVVAAPGVDQVASTFMDPLGPVRVTGLAWFNSSNGNNVKGYQHTQDDGDSSSTATFQKGGGMGAVSLVVKAAPVEIGNRVWYDADLNGRQDADEPAINGAPVSLFVADANGAPTGPALASTTTATINGEPGTYYFRSADATNGVPGFVKDAKYVVVFGKLSDTTAVDLRGPNATHPGFAGLTWGDLVRTVPTSSQATTANDSNPDVVNGYAPVTVGGASQNDHTIDAGWYGTTTYQIKKTVAGTPPPGSSWTVNVSSAVNFRGDGRLTGGAPTPTFVTTPGDPLVTETSFTLTADQTIATTQQLPYGYTLGFAEAGMPASAVSITPSALVVSPAAKTPAVDVLVTNSYTGFTVTKLLDGPSSTVAFPIDYEYSYTPVGADTPTTVTGSGSVSTATGLNVTGIPVGATVKVKEGSPLPSIPGWTWDELTWTIGGVPQTPDDDGWVTFTASTMAAVALSLTNGYTQVTGNFAVEKTATGSGQALIGDAEFYVEYKVGSLTATSQTLGPLTLGGGAVPGPGGYPYGTVIYLREQTPPVVPGIDWGTPSWSGTGSPTDGWQSLTVTGDPTVASLGLSNEAVLASGGFSVAKTVSGTGSALVPADTAFGIEYQIGVADPVQTTVTAGTPFALAGIDFGTVVKVKETTPLPTIPGVAWGVPAWTVDGEPVVPGDDGSVSVVVGDGTTLAFGLTNTATQQSGAFSLLKSLQGTGSALAPTDYTVQYKIGVDGAVKTATLPANGTTPVVPEAGIPLPATVFVREVPPADVPGVRWGSIDWTIDGVAATPDADGWISFDAVTDTTAALVVTNTATQLFGQFQVSKSVTGSGQSLVPADTEFTFTYTLDGGEEQTLTATQTEASDIVGELPVGTVVAVCEPDFPEIAGVEWGTPVWSVGEAETTAECVTITIDGTTAVALGVTNTATQLFGQFQVSKTVTGTGADLVPDDTRFGLTYALDDGTPVSLDVTPAEASDVVGALPFGTVVEVCEAEVPAVEGIEWGEPSWTIGDETTAGECVAFTVDGTTLVSIGLQNTATAIFGTFEITKTVAGDGSDRVPDTAEFFVEYSIDRGNTWTTLDPLTPLENVVSGPELPVGTVVYVREVVPGSGPSWNWGDPSFSGTGINPPGEGAQYASFVISGKDAAVGVSLTNTALASDGTFAIHKSVTGSEAASADPTKTFTVSYTYEGLEAPLTLLVRAGETVTSLPIPTGTVVTVSEVRATGGLPSGAGWGNPLFTLPDGTTATGSIQVTIGADTVLAVELENPTLPELPVTGGALPWAIGLGSALLLALGAILFLGARRRRQEA